MGKLDPRADPLTNPPKAREDFSVDRVAVPKVVITAMFASEEEHAPPVAPANDAADDEDDETKPLAPPGKITSQDPRYEPLEKLLDANDWKKIAAELGPMAEIGKLPPNLGLVAALAHNENAKEGDPEAVTTAIRCMAGLLGLPEASPIARVLARRLLRKNPVRIRDRQAPPAKTSALIVIATLVIGGGVGWLASIGSWPGILRLLHLQ